MRVLCILLLPGLALADVGFGREADHRIFFDLGLTGGGVAGALSGQPDLFATVPEGADVRENTTFVLGDVRLGSKGRSGFNTYLMATGGRQLGDQPALRPQETRPHLAALQPHVLDAHGQTAFFLHQAYGEIQGLAKGGLASKLHLRAGRQHHWGLRALTYDGITFGYRGEALDFSLRGGRRSGVFAQTQTDPGLFAGAGFRGDLARIQGPPVQVHGELMLLSRELDLDLPRDPAFRPDDLEDTVTAQAGIGQLGVDIDISSDVLLSLSAEFAEAVPGHLRGELRWSSSAGDLRVDLDQKIGQDLPYDLGMGMGLRTRDDRTGLTRRGSYEVFRLNIPDRQPYTDARLAFAAPAAPWLTLEPHLTAHVVQAEGNERSAYDADHFGWGLVASADTKLSEQSGLELEVGYLGESYTRDTIEESGLLTDVGAGALGLVHEGELLLRYTRAHMPSRFRRLLTRRWLTLGIGGFARLSTLENRYEEVAEQLVGGQLSARVLLAEHWSLDARYETATASDVRLPELGAFHAARLRLGASW